MRAEASATRVASTTRETTVHHTRCDFRRVIELYRAEVELARANGLVVAADGLPDPSRVDCALNYHLELVDLLGLCAKGRNEFTEKFCRSQISEEAVMRVLGATEVPTLVKSPFVRVLHAVYFSAAADDADAGLGAGEALMRTHWAQFESLFTSFERDIARFGAIVGRSERLSGEGLSGGSGAESGETEEESTADAEADAAEGLVEGASQASIEASLGSLGSSGADDFAEGSATVDALETYLFDVVGHHPACPAILTRRHPRTQAT